MQALKDLFTSFPGLLTVGIIVFMLVMMGYLTHKMLRNMNENK
ncbi:DUF3149 domain-containing protein [Biformimicrobium ophioploci]|uniref:DUF3149 domain-containing protein n=1 Tax=Biformimicrobium ophioploci TaxID=3036711 RepID=A0ABQ6M0D3_9GAMM|nr:DUF3149 domain-containing protein [Microbulbifer sp. NKW57]GMG87805.1 hypothetical protein MNKW57_21260 [Microbulbifer sp. NKW57]